MTEPPARAGRTESRYDVPVTVNGAHRSARVPARRTLADYLRHDLGLTGTHVGCEHGVCGACTVLLDGAPVRSCLIFAISVADQEITTVEGLGDSGAARQQWRAVPGAAGVSRVPRPAVRILHPGVPHHHHRRAAGQPDPHQGRGGRR